MSRAPQLAYLLSAILLLVSSQVIATTPDAELRIIAALVDSTLEVKPVPKHRFEAENADTGQVYRGVTSFDGTLVLTLPAGPYHVRSVEPVTFDGEEYSWNHSVRVLAGDTLRVELSNDNAMRVDGPGSRHPRRPRDPASGDDAEIRWAVGGGLASNVADPEFGDDIEGTGLFFTFHAVFPRQSFFQVSLSVTGDDESGPVDDVLFRSAFSAGYMFRKNRRVRPFVHGGLSLVRVYEEVFGVEVIDDVSISFTAGAGFLAGNGPHNFYLDLGTDIEHEVDDVFGIASNAEFLLTELHLGYVYRF